MDQARKLKFSSYIHLPSINKMFQNRYALLILFNVGEVIIFEHVCYISALEQVRMLISNSYVLLSCIYPILKHGHA